MASRETKTLWIILAVALLVRLPSLLHGLPHLFFLDEFVHTANVFKMFSEKNPFLSFSYLPPLMSYLLAVPIGLAGALGMLFGAWDGIAGFQEFALLRGGYMVAFSRVISMLAGVAAVYALFIFAKRRFGARVALFSAALLAVEYLHVLESQAGRFWAPIALAFLLALYGLYRAHETHKGKWFALSALAIGLGYGLGFGTLFAVPWFAAIAIIVWINNAASRRAIVAATGLMLVLFVFFSAANTYSFGRQFGRMTNTILDPLGLRVPVSAAFNQNSDLALFENVRNMVFDGFGAGFPVVTVLFLIGAVVLIREKGGSGFFGSSAILLVYFPVFYTAMLPFVFNSVNIRYLLPAVLPMIMVASYALFWLVARVPKHMQTAFLLCAILVLFAPRVYTILRHDARLLRADTREQAINWVESNIPSGSAILTNIEDFDLWIVPTEEGVRFKERETPGRIRTRDVYIAGLAENSRPLPGYVVIDTAYVPLWEGFVAVHNASYAVVGYAGRAEKNPFEALSLELLATFYPASGEIVPKFSEEDISIYRMLDSRVRYGPYIEIYRMLPTAYAINQ